MPMTMSCYILSRLAQHLSLISDFVYVTSVSQEISVSSSAFVYCQNRFVNEMAKRVVTAGQTDCELKQRGVF